jgi:hypothetical protein
MREHLMDRHVRGHHRSMRIGLIVAASAALVSVSSIASAAPPWVDRRIVLSGEPIAGSVDVGMGFGHTELGFFRNNVIAANGVGFNTEAVLGLVSRVDIGLRLGLRVNQESALSQSDTYARFYGPQPTYPTSGADTFANPEFRVRGKIVDVGVFELGLEGRMIFPATNGSRFGASFGVPMAIHGGHFVRVDTGVYTTIVAYDNNPPVIFEAPANIWFQATDKVFLGPMSGFRAYANYLQNPSFDFILGFGLGVHLVKWLDLKTQFVFPRVNEGAQFFGAGVGVGFVFE